MGPTWLTLMPRSPLHVKPSRKNHVLKTIFAKWRGRWSPRGSYGGHTCCLLKGCYTVTTHKCMCLSRLLTFLSCSSVHCSLLQLTLFLCYSTMVRTKLIVIVLQLYLKSFSLGFDFTRHG